MELETLKMYTEHYGNACVYVAVAANVSPSSVQLIARHLNKVLNLGILR